MALPVGRALTAGRPAGWWAGSQDSALLRSEGGTAFTPKTQPNPASEQCLRYTQITEGKNSCLPASPVSGGKGISPRKDGYFLHNLGNERQSSGSVSSFMWWKIRRTREPYLRASTERERPTNTWIWWERLKSPTPQRKQSIADHKSLRRKKKRSRKYPLWVERRKEEMTK